jgi:hypothetical protein
MAFTEKVLSQKAFFPILAYATLRDLSAAIAQAIYRQLFRRQVAHLLDRGRQPDLALWR